MEQQLATLFDETIVHEYLHWLSWEESMNVEKEVNLVSAKIKNHKNVVIFAKSLWTVVSMKLMVDKWIIPKMCIFVWLPLGYIRNMWFPLKTYLSNLPCPLLFIQNKEDPVGSFLEVVREVKQISDDFSFVELPGNDHDYSDVENINQVIAGFVK